MAIALATGVALASSIAVASAAAEVPLGPPLTTGRPTATEVEAAATSGLSIQQIHEDRVAEGRFISSGMVGKVEAALGSEYGGAWFDPATAIFHFDLTSDRHAAALAAIEDEEPAVVVAFDRVERSWKQLEALQDRWNRRLAPLLAEGKARTSLDSEQNAVRVLLARSVPRSDRGLLLFGATADAGAVIARVAGVHHLGLERQANTTTCNEWVKEQARCDGPMTAGVSIEGKWEGSTKRCTAGPLAIKAPNNHETFLLTAGHCLRELVEGWGAPWFAWDRAGNEKEFGKAEAYVDDEDADIGVIALNNPGGWTVAGNPPAYAVAANWKPLGKPLASGPIAGQWTPVEGMESCMEGQTSGHKCGKIGDLDVTANATDHLTEVKGAESNPGDSGAPWIAAGKTPAVWVEGTHVGRTTANAPAFEPLKTAFTELAKVGLKLELLTTANEKRPASRHFMSEVKETWVRGFASKVHVFSFSKGKVECKEALMEGGKFEGRELSEVKVHPEYNTCTAFGQPASVVTTGCNYVVEASGIAELECEAGKAIKIEAKVAKCTVTVASQTPAGTVEFTSMGSGKTSDVEASWKLKGLKYTSSNAEACGPSGEKGEYTGANTVKGYEDAAHKTQSGIKWESE